MANEPKAEPEQQGEAEPQPDDSEPSPERQAELRAAYEANVKVGRPPYEGVAIRVASEVRWILKEQNWERGGEAYAEFRQQLRVHPTKDWKGSAEANLDAQLSRRRWVWELGEGGPPDFRGAEIHGANLRGLCLWHANLQAANLMYANLTDAELVGADLTGTYLAEAMLYGTDLRDALMSPSTSLKFAHLDNRTRLGDVVWNGASLARVDWTEVSRLGDEQDVLEARGRRQRVLALRTAARAYHGLTLHLTAQGLFEPAARYRMRERQLERKAAFWDGKLLTWLFSWLLNLMSGYGDKPGRALACYLAVVGAFTGTYWAITNQVFGFITSDSVHLAWYEALVLSISSFHGRGFFPSMLSLGDPIALVAAVEAIIGLFIELVFIATFTQRFFAR